MMRILLTGAEGQVGWELRRTLAPLGSVIALDRGRLDLGDLDRLRTTVRELAPDLIVNAAAYTAVDRAESEEALAHRVNADAPRVLAEEAQGLGAWFVHYSTDYVFDGRKEGPYFENDAPNPQNAYGRTKLAGERAIAEVSERYIVFRTSWVYADRGRNFLLTMLRLAQERDELKVVADQRGAPTWARMIAEATAAAVVQLPVNGKPSGQLSGIYNLTCAGSATWYDFACAIFEFSARAKAPRVLPIGTAQYPTPAVRPLNSTLSTARLSEVFRLALPDWRDALALCLPQTEALGRGPGL